MHQLHVPLTVRQHLRHTPCRHLFHQQSLHQHRTFATSRHVNRHSH